MLETHCIHRKSTNNVPSEQQPRASCNTTIRQIKTSQSPNSDLNQFFDCIVLTAPVV